MLSVYKFFLLSCFVAFSFTTQPYRHSHLCILPFFLLSVYFYFFFNFLSLSPRRVYPFVSFSLFFSCFSLINSQYCAKNLLSCFLLFLFVSSPNHVFSCPVYESEVFLPTLYSLYFSLQHMFTVYYLKRQADFFFLQNFFLSFFLVRCVFFFK